LEYVSRVLSLGGGSIMQITWQTQLSQYKVQMHEIRVAQQGTYTSCRYGTRARTRTVAYVDSTNVL